MGKFDPDTDTLKTLTGDIGVAVGVDGANNINLVGIAPVTITGDPLTNELAISFAAAVANQFDTDVGSATPALNILTVAGGTNINSAGAGSTVTVNLNDAITLTTVNATNIVTTNLTASALGRGIVQSSAAGVFSSSEGTNGQLMISSSTGAAAWANITSIENRLEILNVANAVDIDTLPVLQSDSGFEAWTGAGNYFDDTTLGDFELLRGGSGYIKGAPIAWTGPQTVAGMTAGNCYWIYIDDTGTIGKTNIRSDSTFEDNIVLFKCLRDSTAAGNNQLTVKNNYSYKTPIEFSRFVNKNLGSIIENDGANITLNGTQGIQINGADILANAGLETTIADSGGVAETWCKRFTLAGGKWALHNSTNTFTGYYNNAGVATALTAGKYGIYTLYASKNNLNTATPTYCAVLHTAQFNNLALAQTALSNGDNAVMSGEFEYLAFAQLGTIIYSETVSSIVQVNIDKSSLRSGIVSSGTNIASLVSTVTTDFGGILSAADTNVQAALDTLDDYTPTFCSNAEAIAGTEAAKVVAPLTLKAKLGTQTSHGIAYGATTTGAVAWTTEMSDGQLLVGDTGGVPIPATLTGEHGIEVTNAAGSVSIGNKLTINAQVGTAYTAVILDQNKFITMTNAAASTLTIPPHADVAYDVGCVLYVQQLGAGQVTLTPGAAVTFKSADDAYKLVKQNSCAALIQTIQDQWCIAGDVEA